MFLKEGAVSLSSPIHKGKEKEVQMWKYNSLSEL